MLKSISIILEHLERNYPSGEMTVRKGERFSKVLVRLQNQQMYSRDYREERTTRSIRLLRVPLGRDRRCVRYGHTIFNHAHGGFEYLGAPITLAGSFSGSN